MIDRRAFVAGAALVAVTPAFRIFPLDALAQAADQILPVLAIDGWSDQNETNPDIQIWLRIGQGWRTAWR